MYLSCTETGTVSPRAEHTAVILHTMNHSSLLKRAPADPFHGHARSVTPVAATQLLVAQLAVLV